MALSQQRIVDISDKLFWDYPVDKLTLVEWLSGKGPVPPGLELENLYARLFATVPWYELLELIPRDHWTKAFSESVLVKLFPSSLRSNFRYAARKLLS